MFSKNNITINYPMDLGHRIALLIDLSLGDHLQIFGERQGKYVQKWQQFRAKLTTVSIGTMTY